MNVNKIVKIWRLEQDDTTGLAEYTEIDTEIGMYITQRRDDVETIGDKKIRGLEYDFVAECEVDVKINDKIVEQDGEESHYLVQRIIKENYEGTFITQGIALKEV